LLAASCGGSRTGGAAGPADHAEPPAAAAAPADPAAQPGAPAAPHEATPIADAYREVAARIIAAAEKDTGAWQQLEHLTLRTGRGLGGSPQLGRAIEGAVGARVADGHENVRAEEVMVPHWERGAESARIVAPLEQRIAILGLGGTPATPRRG